MDSSLSKRATPFPGVRAVNKGSTSEAVTLALKPCPSPDISNQEVGAFAKEICTLLRTCSGVRKIHGTSRRWHRCSKPGVGKEGGEKKIKKGKNFTNLHWATPEISMHGQKGWSNRVLRKSVRSWTCRAVGSDREGMEPSGKAETYKKRGTARWLGEAARVEGQNQNLGYLQGKHHGRGLSIAPDGLGKGRPFLGMLLRCYECGLLS